MRVIIFIQKNFIYKIRMIVVIMIIIYNIDGYKILCTITIVVVFMVMIMIIK